MKKRLQVVQRSHSVVYSACDLCITAEDAQMLKELAQVVRQHGLNEATKLVSCKLANFTCWSPEWGDEDFGGKPTIHITSGGDVYVTTQERFGYASTARVELVVTKTIPLVELLAEFGLQFD